MIIHSICNTPLTGYTSKYIITKKNIGRSKVNTIRKTRITELRTVKHEQVGFLKGVQVWRSVQSDVFGE